MSDSQTNQFRLSVKRNEGVIAHPFQVQYEILCHTLLLYAGLGPILYNRFQRTFLLVMFCMASFPVK